MKALKFSAKWCGPCKALTQVVKNAGDKLPMQVEEVDIDDNIMLSTQFQVRSVPTLVVVDEQENEIRRKVGMVNESQLIEFLKG